MANKITRETRYKGMSFHFVREVKGLKMYLDEHDSYAIIVNKDDEVLFEVSADCNQNLGFLRDAAE